MSETQTSGTASASDAGASKKAASKKAPSQAARKSAASKTARKSAATSSKKSAASKTSAQKVIDQQVEAETRKQTEARAQQLENDRLKQESDLKASENSLAVRAADASLGLVEHFGCRGLYVGRAPQSEKGDSKCPTCAMVLTGGNSKFMPLPFVVPEAGLLVKDPNSGEFFALPSDGTLALATAQTWLSIVNPETGKSIIPEADKSLAKERRAAAGLIAA